MVINLGSVRNADFTLVGDDIRRVVAATENAVVKVIIECCLLDNAEKRKLVDIVVEKLGIDKEIIKPTSTFQDLGADSLDVVEIIMKLEEQFSIEIKDEDAEKMSKVADAIKYIEDKVTTKGSS